MKNLVQQAKFFKLLCALALFIAFITTSTIIVSANDNDEATTPPDITVRFAPSPGTFEADESNVHIGHFGFRIEIFPEPIPPEGYIFVGWFVNGNIIHPPVAAVRNITMLAAYAPKPDPNSTSRFAILFDPGPGELPAGVPPILSLEYNSPIVYLPLPTQEGYRFNGWWWNDELVTLPFIVQSDMIFEAEWIQSPASQPIITPSYPIAIPAQHFVAAFNPFPGVFPGGEIGIRFSRINAFIRDIPDNPTRSGSVFVGWQLPNGRMLADSPILRSDIMLTAVWELSDSENEALLPSPPVEIRHNPQTSPLVISLSIFGGVIGLGLGLYGALKMRRKQAAATGKYHSEIIRYVREIRMEIKNRRK